MVPDFPNIFPGKIMETDHEKLAQHAQQSAARWLEYFKNIGATEKKTEPELDWEPLHIGFRDE